GHEPQVGFRAFAVHPLSVLQPQSAANRAAAGFEAGAAEASRSAFTLQAVPYHAAGLGHSRQVLEMDFRPPQPAEVTDVLRAGDLSCRIRSPEAIYARAAGLLAQAPKATPGDDQPVVITTCGPLARAFREAAQSIAPSAIVPGGPDARKLVQLAAAPAPEERLRVVEQMLAASAVVPPG